MVNALLQMRAEPAIVAAPQVSEGVGRSGDRLDNRENKTVYRSDISFRYIRPIYQADRSKRYVGRNAGETL